MLNGVYMDLLCFPLGLISHAIRIISGKIVEFEAAIKQSFIYVWRSSGKNDADILICVSREPVVVLDCAGA
jgi:hypothetical protein